MTTTVHTFGHGTLPTEEFTDVLSHAHIGRIVDVRSFPGSRHNPQFGRQEMERWLPDAGIDYIWMKDLGGRRRPVPESRHVALRNDSFRAYADYMETSAFLAGVGELMTVCRDQSVAVMCSESLWWRCHRRLLADHLVAIRHVEVLHLMHDGRVTVHPLTPGVRVDGSTLVYDIDVTPTVEPPR
jgi:uncharacterized protein (DUF488 family)